MQHLLAEVQTDLVEVLEVDFRVDTFEFRKVGLKSGKLSIFNEKVLMLAH